MAMKSDDAIKREQNKTSKPEQKTVQANVCSKVLFVKMWNIFTGVQQTTMKFWRQSAH